MLPLKQKPTHIKLAPADCVIFPGSIRFGADADLTVITAYLQETPAINALVKKQQHPKREDLPIAYIMAYDVEYRQISLICVYENHVTQDIKLSMTDCSTLYHALQKTILSCYELDPETILNEIRKSAGMKPLEWLHEVTPARRTLLS